MELLYSGRPFFDALEACIQRAQQALYVQVYILNPDDTGKWVLGLLYQAAARGVRVSLLVDAYGSMELSRKWVEEIRQAGIEFRFFGRLFSKNLSIGRRLHHKIVVVDGQEMLIGGINFADRYNEVQGQPAWLDFAVYLRGPLAAHAQQRCAQIWSRRHWSRLRVLPTGPNGVLACGDNRKFRSACAMPSDMLRESSSSERLISSLRPGCFMSCVRQPAEGCAYACSWANTRMWDWHCAPHAFYTIGSFGKVWRSMS